MEGTWRGPGCGSWNYIIVCATTNGQTRGLCLLLQKTSLCVDWAFPESCFDCRPDVCRSRMSLRLWVVVLATVLVAASTNPVPDCELSKKESAHFFCQSDPSWLLRKRLALDQYSVNNGQKSMDTHGPTFWQRNWEPEVGTSLH